MIFRKVLFKKLSIYINSIKNKRFYNLPYFSYMKLKFIFNKELMSKNIIKFEKNKSLNY